MQKANQRGNILLRNEETSRSVRKHQQYTPEVQLLWKEGQRPRERTGKKHFLCQRWIMSREKKAHWHPCQLRGKLNELRKKLATADKNWLKESLNSNFPPGTTQESEA